MADKRGKPHVLESVYPAQDHDAVRTFEVYPDGDPFGRCLWSVRESDGLSLWWFRGDLSPSRGRDRTVRMLRRLYPGCRVRVAQR